MAVTIFPRSPIVPRIRTAESRANIELLTVPLSSCFEKKSGMWVLFLGQPNSVVRKTELYISCLPMASLDLGVQDAGSIVGMSLTLPLSA